MENHDKKCLEKFRGKTRIFVSCRSAFVNYISAPEFPATISIVSGENDIDILNTASTG